MSSELSGAFSFNSVVIHVSFWLEIEFTSIHLYTQICGVSVWLGENDQCCFHVFVLYKPDEANVFKNDLSLKKMASCLTVWNLCASGRMLR